MPTYAASPSSPAVLYCLSQFIVSPRRASNSHPFAGLLPPFLCASLRRHLYLPDTNMKQTRAHSIHLVFLRSSDNSTSTYLPPSLSSSVGWFWTIQDEGINFLLNIRTEKLFYREWVTTHELGRIGYCSILTWFNDVVLREECLIVAYLTTQSAVP